MEILTPALQGWAPQEPATLLPYSDPAAKPCSGCLRPQCVLGSPWLPFLLE